EPADAIVVFGAAIWATGPSATLRLRTLRGVELYERGLAPVVVCSGGSSGRGSEPRLMADLMVAQGVPASALVFDEAGATTRATITSLRRLGGGTWRRILAVSSPFHLFRIVEESRRQGIEALPCPTRRPPTHGLRARLRLLVWDARQYAREVVAVWAYRAFAWRAYRAVKRVATELRTRWSSFTGEADAVRQSSVEIWALIRAHQVQGEAETAALPRLRWPVPGRVTSRFAMRHGRLHEGIDIRASSGTPVHPALGGVVLRAGELAGYGKLVVIGHGASYATVYAHLETLNVTEGDRVEPECCLGTSGSTGRSFGDHLHFEVRFDGTAVDPIVFLDVDETARVGG
ncbi:MAG TPA: peptidoglycan DD-metalloendopeptidase family protein, partial [Candidatus Methylomirabilis sp.]|nr:peptidoglycan DD-metalloendopeptidase family protein [Candidatus Methylomirabilis sp.]